VLSHLNVRRPAASSTVFARVCVCARVHARVVVVFVPLDPPTSPFRSAIAPLLASLPQLKLKLMSILSRCCWRHDQSGAEFRNFEFGFFPVNALHFTQIKIQIRKCTPIIPAISRSWLVTCLCRPLESPRARERRLLERREDENPKRD
jgi:hypothetical protein